MSTLLKEDWKRPSKPQALRLIKNKEAGKSLGGRKALASSGLDDILKAPEPVIDI